MVNIEVIVIKDDNLKNTAFGSYETCEGIYQSLLLKNKNTRLSVCTNEKDLEDVVDRKPDFIVLTNKMLITKTKKIWLSEYFDLNNIIYSGSIKTAMQLDLKKTASKLQVITHGVDTARFFTAVPDEYQSVADLPVPFPLFIKPLESANSEGIDARSFVVNFSDFESKVKELYAKYKQPALVEQYLSGREFTVSIIKSDTLLIAPIEIIAPLENDIRILSNTTKTNNTEILKEVLDVETFKKVSSIAISSFNALGARGFGRIDIKMDAQEKCYFIEANLTPGMTRGSSYFPQSFEMCLGLHYDDLVFSMFRSTIKRSRNYEKK